MAFEYGQHFDVLQTAAVDEPVVAHEELAKATAGNLGQLSTAIRIAGECFATFDEGVEPRRRFGMVSADERLDLRQACPRLLGPGPSSAGVLGPPRAKPLAELRGVDDSPGLGVR